MSVSPTRLIPQTEWNRAQNSAKLSVERYMVNSGKYVELGFRQVPLFTLAAFALIYLHGYYQSKEEMTGGGAEEGGANLQAFKKFALDALHATCLRFSQGLPFQILGIGNTLYQVGKQKDNMGKVQTVVSNGLSLGFGALGFVLYNIIDTFGRSYLEMEKLLHHPELKAAMKNIPECTPLEELLKKLTQFNKLMTSKTGFLEGKSLTKLRDEIEETKEKAFESLMQEKFIEHWEGHIQKNNKTLYHLLIDLGGRLEVSASSMYKFIRFMNPFCAYFIGSTLVAIPIANKINKYIEEHYPKLRGGHGPILESLYPASEANGRGHFQLAETTIGYNEHFKYD
jgi:hypothetical protein